MKKSAEIRLRPFRREDLVVDGKVMDWPVEALTAEIEGKVIACAGLQRPDGRLWVFLDIIDERARQPHLLHRAARKLQDIAPRGETIYAHRDRAEPTSGRWLTRLGFRPTGTKHLNYEVWTWQAPPPS